MASPGHRHNILSPEYREIGVGLAVGGRHGTYWTQEFGARRDPATVASPPPEADDAPGDE
jgi:hypothetical protein